MSCDIIIPVWDQLKLTKECIDSVRKHTDYPYQLIIVDNGSDKKTAAYLNSLIAGAGAQIIRNTENLGFVKAVNQGLEISNVPYICILNNDTVVTEGWLTEMVHVAESRKDIGLVNPSSNNLGQDKGSDTITGYAAKLRKFKGQYIEMGACIGFCMLIKKEVVEKIGRLDEIYRGGNFDDTDYSRKAEKEGYLCVRAKGAYVWHHIKSSFLKVRDYEESFGRNQDIFNRRWGRPKRLLYIVTKDHGKLFDWIKNDVYEKAKGGNWVSIYLKKAGELPEIGEHSNMKVEYLSGPFFDLKCIMRILTKKKPFDSIYADDPLLLEKIRKHERIHNIETTLMGG